MTDREFLQEVIRRVAAYVQPEVVKEWAGKIPANKAYGAMDFERFLSIWFDTECVINDVSIAWELLEIVKNAERGVVIINNKEAQASENE